MSAQRGTRFDLSATRGGRTSIPPLVRTPLFDLAACRAATGSLLVPKRAVSDGVRATHESAPSSWIQSLRGCALEREILVAAALGAARGDYQPIEEHCAESARLDLRHARVEELQVPSNQLLRVLGLVQISHRAVR
jgi:hypothetical protein